MSQAEGVALDRWRVDGGAGDAELVSNLLDGVLPLAVLAPLVVHLPGKLYLPRPEFGFLSAGAATCSGDDQSVDRSLGHERVFAIEPRMWKNILPTAVEASMPWSSTTRSTPRALPLVRQFDEVFEGSAESVQPHAVITAIGSLHARGSSADHVRRVRTTRRWSGLWLSGVGRWYERGSGCPRH